jgi:protein-S-isoprenylcysteine O-methyltransferase Ste14
MGYAREPVFFLSRSHPDRPWPARRHPGPYAFVRHPGYTAGILIIAASGPALGSWLAAALVVIFSLPFLLHRAITEDRILQVELAGYSDYAARVRWRLFPGIW